MAEEGVKTCDACGASVYPEHITSGKAGFDGGQLLCAHCLADKKQAEAAKVRDAEDEEALKPIAFDEDALQGTSGSTAIHGYSGAESLAGGGITHDDETKYKRHLDPRSPFGTRCHTFHAKLSPGAVDYMNDQVNAWADSNPAINIKFATSTIGVFEGKQKDPHLIITVFY